MERIDLTCPKCRAIMEYNKEENEIVCPYCGHKELVEEKETIEDLTKRTMQESYAREKGRQIAEKEAMRKTRKTKAIVVIFSLFFVLILSLIIIKNVEPTREYVENPFDMIDITFSGKNGQGIVKVKINDPTKGNLKYTLSKKEKLSEGEIITVTFKNDENYRFGVSEKQYTVKGLAQYIKSINELDEDIKKEIHEISYGVLKSGIEGSYSYSGEITELKPYKFYLLTGDSSNVLYDVYTAKIKTKSGNIYEKYVLVWYQDVIILSDNVWNYSEKKIGGKQIGAGDPKTMNALSKDYAGYITGYLTIDDFKTAVKEYGGIYMKLSEE